MLRKFNKIKISTNYKKIHFFFFFEGANQFFKKIVYKE